MPFYIAFGMTSPTSSRRHWPLSFISSAREIRLGLLGVFEERPHHPNRRHPSEYRTLYYTSDNPVEKLLASTLSLLSS